MTHKAGPFIPVVVQQHAQEAAMLRNTRAFLAGAPHVRLHHLRRLDDRIAAHLDGLAVAGAYGSRLALAALESPGPGEMFAATVRAIEDRDAVCVEKLLSLAEAVPDIAGGLVSAFGWVDASSLRGIASRLLGSPVAFRRQVGLAACAMHRADAGAAAAAALGDADPGLRARGLRVAGDSALGDLLRACLNALTDEDARCACAAARAAVLLGHRGSALDALGRFGAAPGPGRAPGLALVLKLRSGEEVHAMLQALSRDPGAARLLVRCAGVAGDAHYVPWLIAQMAAPALARLAGESFSTLTGADLALLDLERKPPADAEAGPGDDPEDDNVAMDEDEGLPWPDPAKVAAWWEAHGHRFPAGRRLFMGEAPHAAHCRRVLRTGCQRQRAAAAEYLCLLQPGTPLFPVRAPAWRQQQWLDAMDGEGAGP